MRMSIRRFTRLTNAFSKKLENLQAAVALHFAHYNLVRLHKSLRVTPAMAADVTDRLWSLEELVREHQSEMKRDDMSIPELSNLYIDLLERTLTGSISDERGFIPGLNPMIANRYDEHARSLGEDWPERAVTMIGLTRLRHLGKLIRQVVENQISGDLIETGVWRGGSCIYMRAMLAVLGADDRRV